MASCTTFTQYVHLLNQLNVHPSPPFTLTRISLQQPYEGSDTMFSARSLSTGSRLTPINRTDWQACEFPFKRDYGMAPRHVPSSAGLPDNWTTEMDEFICYSDAIGDLSVKVIIISLKKRFPELNMVSGLLCTAIPQGGSISMQLLHSGCLCRALVQGIVGLMVMKRNPMTFATIFRPLPC